jgi:hypothetical protein
LSDTLRVFSGAGQRLQGGGVTKIARVATI